MNNWYGQYPSHWKLERLQNHLVEINESNNPVKSDNILSLTNKLGVVPYSEKGSQGNVAKENLEGYKLAYPDTIVCNCMNVLIGSVGISKYYGCVSPVYYVYKAKDNADLEFINYVFQTVPFQKELRRYANGILEIRLRVSSSNILKREIPIPSKDEQVRIVKAIKDKEEKINDLIANEEKQIEKLKAYKQALISEVVTKGLDPNVPMKDSGVEWIGKIPANWSVAILKSFFKEHKNKNKNMRERNLLSLSYGNIVRKDINSNDGLLPWSFEGYNIVEPGFIVLRLTDLQNDKKSLRTGLVNERGIITSAYVSLSPRTNVNSYYYQKLLHSYDLKKVFYNMGSGVRQSLSYEEVSKIPVLVPPISEQDKICSFIQNELGKYDIFITKKQSLIDLLKQYRQSVIYEYVTGKRKVY